MRKTRQRVHSRLADVDEPEPDSNHSSATKIVRALDSSIILSLVSNLLPLLLIWAFVP